MDEIPEVTAFDRKVLSALEFIGLSDAFTLGKLASDAVYSYLREDTDLVFGDPDAFGAIVRPKFDGPNSLGGQLIANILRKTPTPTQQAAVTALMLIGISCFTLWLNDDDTPTD